MKRYFLLAISILSLASCSNALGKAIASSSESGSLSLSASGSSAKSILPSNMTPASYTASGTSSTGVSAAQQSSSSGSFSFTNLPTGSWTFTVSGLDSSSNVILSGTKAVTINAGEAASASVDLSPASGSGTLSLSLAWTSAATVSAVTGTLSSSSGSSTDLSFTLGSDKLSASYSGSVAAGTYTLVVTAKNGSTVVASSPMESVLVYNKQSSSWSATLADGQFVSTSKDILGFSLSLPDSTVRVGSISGNAISVIVPYSTAVTSLAPTISASTGASVSPASGVAKDFSDYANGVAYTVTASDGSTKAYTVKVTRRAALSFDAQSGSCATTEQDIDYPATTPVSLPTPTRTDYFFAGWYTAAGGAKGGGTRIKASTAVSADQALYAAWISTSASAWTTASSVLPDYDSSSQYFHLSAYGNGVFVEMECCTKVSTARISYAAAPSSTWTNAASLSGTPDSQALATVIYGDKFVALGWGGYIYYSSDGKDWTIATGLSAITSIGSGWTSLAYGNGYYYALQGDGKTAYSRDGISWTLGASLVCADTSVYWNQIAYGGGKVVAAGQVGTIYSYLPVFSSGDGRGGAWASVNSSATTKSTDDNYFLYNSLCYGDGVFVAVPMGNNVAHYSTDGLTWNTSALPDPGTTLKRWNVMYVDGIFVAYINDFYTSSTMLAYSLDGSSWTQASRTAANWDGMGYGDGKLVAFTWRSKNVGIMTP